ncbi:MAG: class I SAM-dependent RNA methyltransferase [Anaerolineae bacterium]
MAELAQIELTDMAHGGDAVGRYQGRAVFVPMAMPGERVTVALEPSTRSYLRGRLVGIERPSPHRIEPACPYFGRCGGCHWQFIDYAEQLRIKESIVRNALQRIGGIAEPPVAPMLGMQVPWRYRNHVQLRINRRGDVGYLAAGSHEIVPTAHCLIAHPLLETMWDAHRELGVPASEVILRAGIQTGERLAYLQARTQTRKATISPPEDCNVLLRTPGGRRQLLAGDPSLHERVENRTFRISADAFFQNNTLQAELLVRQARELLALQPGRSLLDAYCGGGLLGLSLVDESHTLYGIEWAGASLEDARINSAGRGTFWEGDVEHVLQRQHPHVDAIVLDPPRAGCTAAAVVALAACGASRILYVSCDPATLARDIARFTELGYRLQRVQPIDMFPQTYHVETVVLMSRTG